MTDDLTPSQVRRRERAPALSIRALVALRDGDTRTASFALQRLALEQATAYMAAWGFANVLASAAGGGIGSSGVLASEIVSAGPAPSDHPLELAAAFVPAVSNEDAAGATALWFSVLPEARLELMITLAHLAAKVARLEQRNHLYPGTGAP